MDGTWRRRRDAGAALLLVVAVCVVTATAMLAGRLSAGGFRQLLDRRTAAVLAEARAALIGYAAADPNRPGELPCPDFDGDGKVTVAQDYAGNRCRTLRGWLPWYTLRLDDLRDGAGERLWYALTEDYRAGGPAPLSSETPGRLSLDGQADVVAVVVAPGPALDGQARDGGVRADAAVGDYLEGPNAEAGTTRFASFAAGSNDRVLAITRTDLMAAVEQRVLSEGARALAAYVAWTDRGEGGAWPWAVPFGADLAADAEAPLPSHQGRLPTHVPGGWFATGFEVSPWEIAGADVRLDRGAANTVSADTLTRGAGQRVPSGPGGGRCSWSNLASVACVGEVVETCPAPPLPCGLPAGVARRVWAFDLAFAGTAVVLPPTASAHATRTVSLAGGPLSTGSSPFLRATDYDAAGREVGAGELWAVSGGTVGMLSVSGVRLYPALPDWYARNGWDRQLYLAVAEASAPGAGTGAGLGRACRAGQDCLVLRDRAGERVRADVPALLIAAGPPLEGQERDPSATGSAGCPAGGLCAYLEAGNADGDDAFTLAPPGPAFNDRLRLLDAGP